MRGVDATSRFSEHDPKVVSTHGCCAMLWKACLLLGLAVSSAAIHAEQTDPCAGLEGSAQTQCRLNQQTLRQQQLQEQLQQQQERQNELDKQQREVQQQLESMRLQNETLRKQLERETAAQPARGTTMDASKNPEVKSWREENPWFGSDYSKTSFAMRYAKQLQQERPDLTGRALLDALSAKVSETFGAKN